MLLGERQKLRRKFAHRVAIECHMLATQAPKRTENNTRSSGGLRAIQLVRSADVPAPRPPWFPGSKTFDVDERGYQRDLKLDLLAPQFGGTGQGRDLVEPA